MANPGDIVTLYGMDPEAYAAHLQGVVNRVDRLEAAMAQRMLEDVERLRKDITAAIADGLGTETWTSQNLQRVDRQIGELTRDWADRYGVSLTTDLREGADLGADMTPGAIRAGSDAPDDALAALTVPAVSRRQVEVALSHSADLVQNLAQNTRRKIDRHLRHAVLGATTASDAMRKIRGHLDTPLRPRGRYGTLAYQAERVVRTELGRTFSLANQAGLNFTYDQLGRENFGEVWSHSGLPGARKGHAAMDEYMVEAGKKFVVNGYSCTGPHDPSLPAGEVINCRCDKYTWNGRWGAPPGGPKSQGTAFFNSARAKRNGWKPGDRPPNLGVLAKRQRQRGNLPISIRKPGERRTVMVGTGGGGGTRGGRSVPDPSRGDRGRQIRPGPAPAGPRPGSVARSEAKYPSAENFRRDLEDIRKRQVRETAPIERKLERAQLSRRHAPTSTDPVQIRTERDTIARSVAKMEAGDYSMVPKSRRPDVPKPGDPIPPSIKEKIDWGKAQVASLDDALARVEAGETIMDRTAWNARVKELLAERRETHKKWRAMARERLRTGDGIHLDYTTPDALSDKLKRNVEKGIKDFGDMFDGQTWRNQLIARGAGTKDNPWDIGVRRAPGSRAFYELGEIHVNGTRDTIHELGHWAEDFVPGERAKSMDFLQSRLAEAEAQQPLGHAFRGVDEYAYFDKFKHGHSIDGAPPRYAGKVYWKATHHERAELFARAGMTPDEILNTLGLDSWTQGIRATEIFSIGVEYMWADPLGFATHDPDYFDHIYNRLRGLL